MSPYVIPGIRRQDIEMTTEQLMFRVCDLKRITIAEMKSENRKRKNVYARKLVMYFLRKRGETLSSIGKLFGKDHTTAIHSINSIEDMLSVNDDEATEDVAKLKELFV